MFNNFFENQSIWNTLSTRKLVLSSYHEKGLGPEYHQHFYFFTNQIYILPGKIFQKFGKFGLRAGQKKAGQKKAEQIRASKVLMISLTQF